MLLPGSKRIASGKMARPFCAYASSLLIDSQTHLEAADQLLEAAQSWLQEQLVASRDQLAECVIPAAKRQRVTMGKKAVAVAANDKVRRTHDARRCGKPSCWQFMNSCRR